MPYRCVATSVGGFIQQLAVSYIARGYWFFVVGWVPEGRDPTALDRKLLARYQIAVSKWERARRKRAGVANVQLIRHERFFVLLATHGHHPFFEGEKGLIQDARRTPIRYQGYAVSYRNGHPHVRIDQEEYNCLKAYLLDLAVHRNAAAVTAMFRRLPFEPYAPVRRQLLNLLRAVNRVRKHAGFEPIPHTCLRLKRRIYRPFEDGRMDP